jgi:hypothetical protein
MPKIQNRKTQISVIFEWSQKKKKKINILVFHPLLMLKFGAALGLPVSKQEKHDPAVQNMSQCKSYS